MQTLISFFIVFSNTKGSTFKNALNTHFSLFIKSIKIHFPNLKQFLLLRVFGIQNELSIRFGTILRLNMYIQVKRSKFLTIIAKCHTKLDMKIVFIIDILNNKYEKPAVYEINIAHT